MKNSNSFKPYLALALVMLLLSACGGGGGGGDDDLRYEGKTSRAKISGSNAADLTSNVVGVYNVIGDVNIGFRSEQDAAAPQPEYLRIAFERIAGIRKGLLTAALADSAAVRLGHRTKVDETEDCEKGKFRIVGEIDENDGTGTLTFKFDDCREVGVTIKGDLVARIDAFDLGFLIPTRVKLTFKNLRVRSSDADVSVGGSLKYAVDIGLSEERETITDLVVADNDSKRMVRIVDLVSVFSYDIFNPVGVTISIQSGRVFDSKYGYVDVETPIANPIFYDDISQDEFPSSGVVLLAANGSITATVLNNSQVQIQADTDGIPGFEFDRIFDWVDL